MNFGKVTNQLFTLPEVTWCVPDEVGCTVDDARRPVDGETVNVCVSVVVATKQTYELNTIV